MQIRSLEDIYPALDELISELALAGDSRLAAILHHRLHVVAWTTSSELYEEIQRIFAEPLRRDDPSLPQRLKEQIKTILSVIGKSSRGLGE